MLLLLQQARSSKLRPLQQPAAPSCTPPWPRGALLSSASSKMIEDVDKHVLRKYDIVQKLGKGVSLRFRVYVHPSTRQLPSACSAAVGSRVYVHPSLGTPPASLPLAVGCSCGLWAPKPFSRVYLGFRFALCCFLSLGWAVLLRTEQQPQQRSSGAAAAAAEAEQGARGLGAREG